MPEACSNADLGICVYCPTWIYGEESTRLVSPQNPALLPALLLVVTVINEVRKFKILNDQAVQICAGQFWHTFFEQLPFKNKKSATSLARVDI